ncbi:hypothetical protein [Rhodococcus gannanensis]|uniref:Uncharacterized protein n=1 Tax=Rhodococcus gannanensis TaxID=1960308 RepID=A0ABW4PBI8_9NOCA
MNATATIARLRALIDHPRTGAEERAAARRMLDRLLAKQPGTAAGRPGPRRTGLGRHVRIEHVVDAIRIDLALARTTAAAPRSAQPLADGHGVVVRDPIRDAPEGIVFDVTADGEFAVVVTIDGVPPDWGWDEGVGTVSPRLQGLADRVAEVVNGYGDAGPDGSPRFFGRVRVPGHTLVW